jgi:hypothetical protein
MWAYVIFFPISERREEPSTDRDVRVSVDLSCAGSGPPIEQCWRDVTKQHALVFADGLVELEAATSGAVPLKAFAFTTLQIYTAAIVSRV